MRVLLSTPVRADASINPVDANFSTVKGLILSALIYKVNANDDLGHRLMVRSGAISFIIVKDYGTWKTKRNMTMMTIKRSNSGAKEGFDEYKRRTHSATWPGIIVM